MEKHLLNVMPNLNYSIAEINDIVTINDDANRGANYEEIKDILIANIRQKPNITHRFFNIVLISASVYLFLNFGCGLFPTPFTIFGVLSYSILAFLATFVFNI